MITKLLSRLEKVRQTSNNEWGACCPYHGDEHPSLSVKISDEGKILIHCHSMKCDGSDIVESVGMELSDLFPKSEVNYDKKQKRTYFNPATVLLCIRHESIVLALAAEDIINGTALPEDAERIKLAHERIYDATLYCFNPR
ncbi:MAG: hypothetical protein PHH73_06065 [Candidatus Rickettsiella isopodorum]|nr:hypothetical protein [Candidatus Rickettsiella isopodorum]